MVMDKGYYVFHDGCFGYLFICIARFYLKNLDWNIFDSECLAF